MSDDARGTVRKLAKGSGVIFLGFFLELGLAFVAKILMAQILGPTDYGSVSIGIVLAANLSTIALLGLNTGVGRFLPRFDSPGEKRGILLSAFGIAMPVAVATGALVALAAHPIATVVFDTPSLAPIVRVFGIAIPFAALLKLSVGGIQGIQRSLPKVAVRNVAQPVIRFSAIVAVLWLGFRSVGIAYAYLVAYVAAGLLGVGYLLYRTPILSRVRPARLTRELASFSGPLAVSNVAFLIVSGIGIDTLMIGIFASPGDVGVYNVVYPLANLLTMVFSSLSFLFMPILSELHAEERTEQMGRLYEVATKWIALSTLPLLLVMVSFPTAAIVLTFSAQYEAGATALVVLAVGFFVNATVGLNENVLQSIGDTGTILRANAVAAVVNVVLNLALVPTYSYLGAAVGTAAAYTVLGAFYLYAVHRRTGFHPFTRSLTVPAVAGTAVIGVLYLVVTATITVTPLRLIGVAALFLVAYAVVVVRFGGIEGEEVMLVLSLEERAGVDLGPLKRVADRLMP